MGQISNHPYCNVTTHLQQVFKDIEDYNSIDTLEGFTASSGLSNTYQINNCGYYGAIFEDGTALTIKTSTADVDSNASSWYYDSTNDILYVHTSGSDAPSGYTITGAVDDWKTYKETQRNNAMEMMDSMIDPKYPRPLPMAKRNTSYEEADYDYDIRRSAALLTCYLIVKGRNPSDSLAEMLYQEVWNPDEDSGILWEHIQGKRAFSFETTVDEFSGRMERIDDNTDSGGRIYLCGKGNAIQHKILRLKIDTAGVVETATFKVSDDDGVSWYTTENSTWHEPIYLHSGVWVRFEGTFTLDDEWRIEIAGAGEYANIKIGSTPLTRNSRDLSY